jgi:hypothetical protein
MMERYGRSAAEWDRLAEAGKSFLIELARMKRTTSYTEFNAALGQSHGYSRI